MILAGAMVVATMIGLVTHDLAQAMDGDRAGALFVSALLFSIGGTLLAWRRYRIADRAGPRAPSEGAGAVAPRDPLTGFNTRSTLIELGTAMRTQAERRYEAVALLMIDLDKFKIVNDLHGHLLGDRLIGMAAERIAAALPPHALTARPGSDEFACVFAFDPAIAGSVDGIAERLLAAMAQPFPLGGVQAHVTASIGIARSDRECTSVEQLLRRADIAMHDAKDRGRNRFRWFDRQMEEKLQARLDIAQGLRDAIPAGQIVPYYEKQVELATGALIGFEMLARWEHPTRGLIQPDDFIPVAEEGGLIADLSLALMRTAFEQARGWDPGLTLSINIAPTQLKDPWFAQKIVKLLTETGFPPQRLEIEITETSLFENLGLAQSILGSLKNQGIRIALDDFGTGYSSLAHLRALPFDQIKIDKSFVVSMETNTENAAIVDAITRLGDSLGLPITAEGIETAGIEQRLIALGCRKGQGYHFGRPMTIQQVRALLAAQGRLLTARAAPVPQQALRRAG